MNIQKVVDWLLPPLDGPTSPVPDLAGYNEYMRRRGDRRRLYDMVNAYKTRGDRPTAEDIAYIKREREIDRMFIQVLQGHKAFAKMEIL